MDVLDRLLQFFVDMASAGTESLILAIVILLLIVGGIVMFFRRYGSVMFNTFFTATHIIAAYFSVVTIVPDRAGELWTLPTGMTVIILLICIPILMNWQWVNDGFRNLMRYGVLLAIFAALIQSIVFDIALLGQLDLSVNVSIAVSVTSGIILGIITILIVRAMKTNRNINENYNRNETIIDERVDRRESYQYYSDKPRQD